MARAVKYPWQDKVINHAQIGGIETSVLDNGLGRGVRIAWINTGSGLRYKVVIDRCLDIVDAFYNEHSLAMLSHGGVTMPRPDANAGLEWLYTFACGLVTTCGLSSMGMPEEDEDGQRGLHGRASSVPAELESIVQPDPVRGKLDMSITAVMRETKLFGPNLELRRTISGRLGEPIIRIHDVVTNAGTTATPHMMLYHCNFGWPLVDEGAEFVYRGTCESFGREQDDALFASRHNYRKCCRPMDLHRGSGESCGLVDVTADRKGMCTVGIYNPKIKLALSMRYAKKGLPCLTNWQHWGYGDYVTALEPGTNSPAGQTAARKAGELIMLRAGRSRTYDLEFNVLTDPKAIKAFRSTTG